MVANGGQLVTPYVVSDVETPGSNGQRAVVQRRFAPEPPRDAGVDPAALQVVREGLYSATHSRDGTSSGIFGGYPIPIAGKTGTAEKVVPLPGYPADHLEDQAWWCGYGPSEDARIVFCAVIENGGHGGTAAAPAAMHVIEEFFGVKGGPTVAVKTD
jgi:penicillin-binding protein 2